jgi:hypothetical protein
MATYYCMTLNEAVTVFERPLSEYLTAAVPPVPLVPMCQVQPTLPLLPTVRLEALNDGGTYPVQYRTDADNSRPASPKHTRSHSCRS